MRLDSPLFSPTESIKLDCMDSASTQAAVTAPSLPSQVSKGLSACFLRRLRGGDRRVRDVRGDLPS